MLCPVYHLKIAALTALLASRHHDLDRNEVKHLLYSEVNSQYDKNEDAYNSTSAAEANAFVRKLYDGSLGGDSTRETIARELESIFFPGGLKPFKENGDVKIDVASCHDGDTCRITEPPAAGCKKATSPTSIRITGNESRCDS